MNLNTSRYRNSRFRGSALHCEQEISIGNVIGDNIITITLVFGLVALIRSFQVFLSEILSTVRESHRKNTRSATHILATYPLFFSALPCPFIMRARKWSLIIFRLFPFKEAFSKTGNKTFIWDRTEPKPCRLSM